jgi:hypothetical protein
MEGSRHMSGCGVRHWLTICLTTLCIGACNHPPGSAADQTGPVPEPTPQRAVASAPGTLYRLALRGVETPAGRMLSPVSDTLLCCDGVRAGWLVFRLQHWIAVDTVAVNIAADPHRITLDIRGPFRVVVDSGLRDGSISDRNVLLFRSGLAPTVIPQSPSIGTRRGDTLTITNTDPMKDGRIEMRVYVRVR